jgi:hypothetical protein
MLRSALFEKVIREGLESPNRLFERILREAEDAKEEAEEAEEEEWEGKDVTSDTQGKIIIRETEKDKQKDNIQLKKSLYKIVVMKIRNKKWTFAIVNSCDPPLKVQIKRSGIDHWYHDSHDRNQILCIKALPLMIQNLVSVNKTKNDDPNKQGVNFFYKGICNGVIINEEEFTITLEIEEEIKKDPKFYCLYVNGISLKKID